MKTEEVELSVRQQMEAVDFLVKSGKVSPQDGIPMLHQIIYWGRHYVAFDAPPPEITYH